MDSLTRNIKTLVKNAWTIKRAKGRSKKSNLDVMDSLRNISSLIYYCAKNCSEELYVGLILSLNSLEISVEVDKNHTPVTRNSHLLQYHETYFTNEGWENLAKKNNLDPESDTIYEFYIDMFDNEFETLSDRFKAAWANLSYHSTYRGRTPFNPTIFIRAHTIFLDFTEGAFIGTDATSFEERSWFIKESEGYYQEEITNKQIQRLAEKNQVEDTFDSLAEDFKDSNMEMDFLSLEPEILPKKSKYKYAVKLLKFIDSDDYLLLFKLVTKMGGKYMSKGFCFPSDAIAKQFISLVTLP